MIYLYTMRRRKRKFIAYFPAFLNIRKRKCVVVGGGNVALRKVRILLDCDAAVTVVSPDVHPELARLARDRAIQVVQRDYRPGDLKGVGVVVAATDVKKVNRKIADEAKRHGSLVNVVDDPAPSNFIVPSFFRRGNLTIAISTAGMSPALATKIRTRLEQDFGAEYASLLYLVQEVRSKLKKEGMTVSPDAWQKSLDIDRLVRLVRVNQLAKAKTLLIRNLKKK